MIGKLSFAVVAALLLVSAAPVPVEAAVCKSSKISALGKWQNTMYGARASARYAWKRKARAVYGTKFDTWWRGRQELRLLVVQQA